MLGGRGDPPVSWVKVAKRTVYWVQLVVSVRLVPKSLPHEVQTPPAGSVLWSGTLMRTAPFAELVPFLAQKVNPVYRELLYVARGFLKSTFNAANTVPVRLAM